MGGNARARGGVYTVIRAGVVAADGLSDPKKKQTTRAKGGGGVHAKITVLCVNE